MLTVVTDDFVKVEASEKETADKNSPEVMDGTDNRYGLRINSGGVMYFMCGALTNFALTDGDFTLVVKVSVGGRSLVAASMEAFATESASFFTQREDAAIFLWFPRGGVFVIDFSDPIEPIETNVDLFRPFCVTGTDMATPVSAQHFAAIARNSAA